MEDEPLAVGVIEIAETHPSMLRLPIYPLTMLGEVSHVWGVVIFCCGVLCGMISWKFVPMWFAVWKLVAVVSASDYHMAGTLSVWLQTAALDRRKVQWGGTSVSDAPQDWDVPRGMFDDAA